MVYLIRATLFLGSFFSLTHFITHLNAQVFAPKKFYIVDSLDLSQLTSRENELLDSCLNTYHNSQHDTNRIKVLVNICDQIYLEKTEKYSFKLLQSLEAYKRTSNFSTPFFNQYSAISMNNLGHIYKWKGQLGKALLFHQNALTLSLRVKDQKEVSESLLSIAHIEYIQGKTQDALKKYKKVLEIMIHSDKKNELGVTLIEIANIYKNRGEMNRAIKYFELALNLCKDYGPKRGIPRALRDIGSIYYYQKQFDQAMKYYKKSLDLHSEVMEKGGMAITLNAIAETYREQGKLDAALSTFKRALNLNEKIKNKTGMTSSLNNIGNVYLDLNNYPKATKFYFNSLNMVQQIGYKKGLATCLSNVGLGYLKQSKLDSAVFYCSKGLHVAKKFNYIQVIQSTAKVLSETYRRQGRNKLALEMYQKHTQIKDSISGLETQKALNKLENKILFLKKNQEIALLKKEKQLKEAKFQISLFIYGILFFLVIGVAFLWIKNKKVRYEKELEHLRQLLHEKKEKKQNIMLSIPVCVGKRLFSVKMEDVFFFKGESKYVFLTIKDGQSFIVDYTLSTLEKTLPKNFTRIHRSIIINDQHIIEIKKTTRKRIIVTLNDNGNTSFTSTPGYSQQAESLIDNHHPYLVK